MYFQSLIDGNLETFSAGPGWKFQTKSMIAGFLSLSYNIEDVKEEFSFSDDSEVQIPLGRYEFVSFRGMITTPMSRKFYAIIMSTMGGFYDVDATYQFNWINFVERSQKFNEQICRLKMLYMYNTKLSASTFIQYNSSNNVIISNFRLRYNPKEGNDFYIVFNEGRNTYPDMEIPAIPKISDRTFLVKYTYTFNL